MAKPITGFTLEPLERILTLGKNLAPGRLDHKVIIDKISGIYRLQITFLTGSPIPPPIDLPLGPKIPPDTGVAITSKKKKAKKK